MTERLRDVHSQRKTVPAARLARGLAGIAWRGSPTKRVVKNLAQGAVALYRRRCALTLPSQPQDRALSALLRDPADREWSGRDSSAAWACTADDDEVELGYWIAREYWGRGYATEAARAVLRLAKVLGHREAGVAGHFIDNPASGAVLRKVGFEPTGKLRRRYQPVTRL